MEDDVKANEQKENVESIGNFTEMEHQNIKVNDTATEANTKEKNSKAHDDTDTGGITKNANETTEDHVTNVMHSANLGVTNDADSLSNKVTSKSDFCISNINNSKECDHTGSESNIRSHIESATKVDCTVKPSSSTADAQEIAHNLKVSDTRSATSVGVDMEPSSSAADAEEIAQNLTVSMKTNDSVSDSNKCEENNSNGTKSQIKIGTNNEFSNDTDIQLASSGAMSTGTKSKVKSNIKNKFAICSDDKPTSSSHLAKDFTQNLRLSMDHSVSDKNNLNVENNADSESQTKSDTKETPIDNNVKSFSSKAEANTGAKSKIKTNPKIEPSAQADPQLKFMQNVSALREKTKSLREKLNSGWGKLDLQQQEVRVPYSETMRRANDADSVIGMSKLKQEQIKNEIPTTPQAAIASKHAQQARENIALSNARTESSTMQFETQNTAKREHKKKTRRQLEEQLYGLQELLRQLTLQDPQIESKVRQLASNSPQLQELQLLPQRYIAGENAQSSYQRQRLDSERSNQSIHSGPWTRDKQRHVSEASANSVLDSTSTKTSTGEEGRKRKRRRNRSKKRNEKIKSEKSEQDVLTKYLQMIIEDYLGEAQADKFAEYAFKPDEENLESYAQRLVLAGMGRIVEEEITINRKNNRQSFVPMSADRESSERDGIIMVPVARRYAFEGDFVRAFVLNASSTPSSGVAESLDKKKSYKTEETLTRVKDDSFCVADDEENRSPDEESPDSDIDPNDLDVSNVAASDGCPKAFVISIVKQTEKREVVGTISFKNPTKLNDDQDYYKLRPHDMRFPMVYIPVAACEAKITAQQKADICGFLYVCRVLQTDAYGHCIGDLEQPVGKVGNLEAEIKAILIHNGLRDICPFEERFNQMFAEPDAPLSEKMLEEREDLRKKCVFTIDPLTARDLDDAMSIDCLSEGIYEIGVHISDVSYYLHENTELDNIVKDRATSIYLVNEVIHMLPKSLCFKCSLLPGEDKLTFSVFWRMNLDGEIIGKPRFSRSIINSCSQFAYEHAQKIIDNPEENFDVDDFPTITNGFTPNDISTRVKILDSLAKKLRAKRYDDGALSINNPKLRFNMDPQTGEPISYEVEARQDANFLIEEFMLLANQSVARFIHDRFPDIAILRNHAPPLSKSLKMLKEKLSSLGIQIDFSSSKTIYESMQKVCASASDPKAMDTCLSTLLTKPMARAKYFCSEGKTEESDLWHYSLSIPIYTHFTSPIRRYPDILVHRLLAAGLNYCPPPKRTTDELHLMAKVCNDQKFNAKNAGDESTNLFFKRFIKSKQSITLRAVVTEIFRHFINVVTIDTGHAISIQYKMQKVLVDASNAPAYILICEKNSKNPPLKLQMFSTVLVKLVIWDDKIYGFFVSPDQKQRQLNSIESSKKKSYEQMQKQQNSTTPNDSFYANVSAQEEKVVRRKQRLRNMRDENGQKIKKNKDKNKEKNENKSKYKNMVYAVSK